MLSDIGDDLRDGGTRPKDGLHTLRLECWDITVRDRASSNDQHIVGPLGLEQLDDPWEEVIVGP